MLTNNIGENIPDFSRFPLDHFLGRLNRCSKPSCLKLAKNERLEQLKCHFFGQTTLVESQRWPNNNDRTTRIVHSLTKQILTESTLFTLDHVCQRLKWALVSPRNGPATSSIIQQRIYSFLQHSLLITHDNVRCGKVQQPLQTIVPVDHPAVQVVKVGSRKTSTFERY